ncbi:MAG: riboflavin biosynthesis protein RibF [Candidatus Omnitrophica bacterium]|nr:riboflavin biosynthesis protein RibF [Candidatus Omnitrophota bacterium]
MSPAARRGRILRGLRALTRPPPHAVVTVGVFDGVHRAHQRLIRSVIRMARRRGGRSVILTFDPDPQTVLRPARAQPSLMPLGERLTHLQALGADVVWVVPFTRRFARMTAAQFIRRILIDRVHAEVLLVGEAFAFGRGRRGDMEVLRALGPRYGMRVVPVRQVTDGGEPISSSRIRQLIAKGHLGLARRLLGRAPALYGRVVRGTGRGRRFHVPTANVQLGPHALPPSGVYAVRLRRLGHPRAVRGVMNLGTRPTFGAGPLVCEVHLLGFSGTLTGQPVSVSLLARLRSERCFPSPAALYRQVRRDLRRARRLFPRLT